MEKFEAFTSKVVVLPESNIDTDQIIPARFLKVTDKKGLGAALFADWRYQADGSEKPAFILNQKDAKNARVLLAGDNFGCGSSREHAPWALTGYGFKAIISTSFADIFKNNALKNGLLPIVVGKEKHQALMKFFENNPQADLTVDLAEQVIVFSKEEVIPFPIEAFSKACLLQGMDELDFLLSYRGEVEAYESKQT